MEKDNWDLSNQGKRWTKEEKDFLERYYESEDTENLAIELKRNYMSVKSKSNRIGLYKKPKEDLDSNMRYCNQCKDFKDISLFYKKKDSSKGVQSICIDCNKLNNAKNSLSSITDKKKEYAEKHKTCKVCNQLKNGDSFPILVKKTGSVYSLNTCKECKSKMDLEIQQKKIKEGKEW